VCDEIRIARLREHVCDARLSESIGLVEIFGAACHRNDGYRARVVVLLQRAAELESVDARHGDIGDDRIGVELACFFERLMTVVRVNGPKAAVTEVIAIKDTRTEIVFDDQHERVAVHPFHSSQFFSKG